MLADVPLCLAAGGEEVSKDNTDNRKRACRQPNACTPLLVKR
jgi:hypothetical protein